MKIIKHVSFYYIIKKKKNKKMSNYIKEYYVGISIFLVGIFSGSFIQKYLFKQEKIEVNNTEIIIPKCKEEVKMVLCVRTDLKMTTGKIASQCSHATLGVYRKIQKKKDVEELSYMEKWLKGGQAKITLKIDSLKSLEELEEQSKKKGIPYFVVADAGKTQIESGSLTVIGIGPAPKKEIDKLTGKLSLL